MSGTSRGRPWLRLSLLNGDSPERDHSRRVRATLVAIARASPRLYSTGRCFPQGWSVDVRPRRGRDCREFFLEPEYRIIEQRSSNPGPDHIGEILGIFAARSDPKEDPNVAPTATMPSELVQWENLLERSTFTRKQPSAEGGQPGGLPAPQSSRNGLQRRGRCENESQQPLEQLPKTHGDRMGPRLRRRT